MNIKRVFIEKKCDYNSKSELLKMDFRDYLKVPVESLRLLNLYDLIGFTEEEEQEIIENILFEKSLDLLYEDQLDIKDHESVFRIRYVDGQFNEREDSANNMVKLMLGDVAGYISHTEVYILTGLDQKSLDKIKSYYINPVEMNEIKMEDIIYRKEIKEAEPVEIIEGFIKMDGKALEEFKENYEIGMDLEDIEFCQDYFKKEDRDPTIAELKLIDTYWSDHCRHTTFMTEIVDIEIEAGKYETIFQEALEEYLKSRKLVYENREKPVCLMDLATINQKEVKKKGLLDDKEDTDEVNAASIEIDVDVDGKMEKWLLMFKNETHNHPTEIEPYGGASTCLGGAIRDPLSGRSYVYQAMRITGAGDIRADFESTLEGKLPQRKISKTAREGYASYGYEIGAATGFVREIYDEGFLAKRMELGALVAAAPKENVYRGKAEAGDLIVLVGGRTGKDGLGGAVGSSKQHTEESLEDSGAEVQKGNPKIERKIVRLFRKPEVSKMIKVCNDFGAGGVSVAIGELAEGLVIDVDKVPVKYEGMNGYEIALSESQERMAALIDRNDLDEFLRQCEIEDVEASLVAEVTEEKVLKMEFKGQEIVNIKREFLDTNGIRKKNQVFVSQPKDESYFNSLPKLVRGEDLREDFVNNLRDLNIGSQKGIIEAFDQSVGKGTVLAAYGGKTRLTPAEGMVAKIPVLEGETETCSIMTYGYDPHIGNWSSFHGGYYAVVESLARVVALGASYERVRLSMQEYFERIGKDKYKWGKPFTALLGAFTVQKAFDTPAIGGKDSMSGSFEDINVPPTLVSFGVTTDKVKNIISPEFKNTGAEVGLLKFDLDQDYLLDLEEVKSGYRLIKDLVDQGQIKSMSTVKYGGYARSIAEMSMGNKIGFKFETREDIFKPLIGSIVIELEAGLDSKEIFKGHSYIRLGETIDREIIDLGSAELTIDQLIAASTSTLEEVFPIRKAFETKELENFKASKTHGSKEDGTRVIIPILPGNHGEYDLAKSFRQAGAQVDEFVFKTFTREDFEKSIAEFADRIRNYQIIAFPDGKIMGNEPETGGKLLEYILRDSRVSESIDRHLEKNRLIIGIGGGFIGLIKSGLIEYGQVRDLEVDSINIVHNKAGGFISEIVEIEVKSNLSPWLSGFEPGEVLSVPVATKEGRIVGQIERLAERGQVATVFKENLLGSKLGIDGISSECGKIIGFTSSIDRDGRDLYKNIDRKKGIEKIFEAGVNYFL